MLGDAGQGMSKAIIKNTEDERRQKLEQAISNQHMLTVRTLEAMKQLVLVDTPNARKTELADYAKGQVDPHLQLILIARDKFLEADEDPVASLGFYKAMRDEILNAEEKNMKVVDMAMRQNHHREKMALLEQKMGNDEPSDAEIDAVMKGGESDENAP